MTAAFTIEPRSADHKFAPGMWAVVSPIGRVVSYGATQAEARAIARRARTAARTPA